MNKILLTIAILALSLLSACAQQQAPVACTMDAKICPDGSAVGRTGPNCEFEACPGGFDDPTTKYVGKSPEECSRIKFSCEEGFEYFSNENGCGCIAIPQEAEEGDSFYMSIPREECSLALIQCPQGLEGFVDDLGCGCRQPQSAPSNEGKLQAIDCKPEQRNVQFCTMDYTPVCGQFDPAKIQCIKYPCAQTFGNACGACSNPDVISYTQGECPEN